MTGVKSDTNGGLLAMVRATFGEWQWGAMSGIEQCLVGSAYASGNGGIHGYQEMEMSYLVKFTAGKGNIVGPIFDRLDSTGSHRFDPFTRHTCFFVFFDKGIFAFLIRYNSGNKDRNSAIQ